MVILKKKGIGSELDSTDNGKRNYHVQLKRLMYATQVPDPSILQSQRRRTPKTRSNSDSIQRMLDCNIQNIAPTALARHCRRSQRIDTGSSTRQHRQGCRTLRTLCRNGISSSTLSILGCYTKISDRVSLRGRTCACG